MEQLNEDVTIVREFMSNVVIRKKRENDDLQQICIGFRTQEQNLLDGKIELCTKCFAMPDMPSSSFLLNELNSSNKEVMQEVNEKIELEKELANGFRLECDSFRTELSDHYANSSYDGYTMTDSQNVEAQVQALHMEEQKLLQQISELQIAGKAKISLLATEYKTISSDVDALKEPHEEFRAKKEKLETKLQTPPKRKSKYKRKFRK